MISTRRWIALGTAVSLLVLAGCGPRQSLTADEAREISKDAFVYGFPLVSSYQALYKQAVDSGSPDYRAPFNVVGSNLSVATPEDQFVVTPNSDTPYSFIWLDLRAEPVVITMPEIEKGRYYSAQLIDLYTFNFAYLGTRAFGNAGGRFLVAGPGWNGEAPTGIKATIRCETEFAYVLFRTQLFNPADLKNVNRIQKGYDAQPLSKFVGQPAPPMSAAVAWPQLQPPMTTSAALFPYLNFLLQFCPTDSSETALMARFARLNIGAGKNFDESKLSSEMKKAVEEGIASAWQDLEGIQKQINAEEISSSDMFGTRDFMKNNYLHRFAGAKLGLYGNSAAEAIYLGYFVDANGQPCDASKNSYTVGFPKGHLPPAGAFWSLTMYDGKSQLLVANPLRRYLLNSTMLKSYRYGSDGSLTLYVQSKDPGPAKQANWLPAPNGPFYAVLRIYMPATEVVSGTWRKPPMQTVP